jgi:hypothetical protein
MSEDLNIEEKPNHFTSLEVSEMFGVKFTNGLPVEMFAIVALSLLVAYIVKCMVDFVFASILQSQQNKNKNEEKTDA